VITVQEVISDPDFVAPHLYTILRSIDTYIAGGVESVVTRIPMVGPVQQSSNKEIQMIPEGDRVGEMKSFWSTIPIFITRGNSPVPSTHGEVPQGGGVTYVLSFAPLGGQITLTLNGVGLTPGIDYVLNDAVITMLIATDGGALYASWPVTAWVQPSNSDILEYDGEQYRVLQRYHDDGGGYWKAIATRLRAA
jgi:hypothetical protein